MCNIAVDAEGGDLDVKGTGRGATLGESSRAARHQKRARQEQHQGAGE